ncbi:hypothetical protein [Niveispirillum fermenti]|uniref:hypothetical protein n=1 Tax=Niveispirillum fermenti TaxID=1233113 RepID=UPI003A85C469
MRDIRLSSLFAAALFAALPLAAGGLPARAAAPDEVLKCLGVTDDAARLACYDRAVPALRQAPPMAAALPPAPPPPVVAASPQQAFGAERLSSKERGIEEVAEITATLVSFQQAGYERYTFTLDNGQVWTQTVARSLSNLRAGRSLRIEKGMVGSYNMVIDGVSGLIKVRRVK